ncbi:hypothetical protein [Ferrovum sp.]|uniref:hypothetical protein n=1 Tax=Ferrovum sp. TaxID=2609467 RepID=UPI0026202E31|nr:hypothetical protein [Ferrovum sp.]
MATNQFFNAPTQQRPVFLVDGKMPPQIQQGDLAHFATDAFSTDEPVGDVGFPGGFVVGSGLANKHSMMLPEKQGVLSNQVKYYGTTQRYCQKQKNECFIINEL